MDLVIKKNEIINLGGYQTDMETLFRQIMPKETTLQEFGLFLAIAKSYELNPYKREIYPIKYGSSVMQIVCGYEVYLKRAERTGKMNGWKVEIAEDNKSATITINRKDWDNPFTWTVEREEFDRSGEAKSDKNSWVRMPKFMLKKVAIGQGFRLAFPDEMGGLPYLQEELNAGMTMDMGNGNFTEMDENALPSKAEKDKSWADAKKAVNGKQTEADPEALKKMKVIEGVLKAIDKNKTIAELDAWVAKNVEKIGKSPNKAGYEEHIKFHEYRLTTAYITEKTGLGLVDVQKWYTELEHSQNKALDALLVGDDDAIAQIRAEIVDYLKSLETPSESAELAELGDGEQELEM